MKQGKIIIPKYKLIELIVISVVSFSLGAVLYSFMETRGFGNLNPKDMLSIGVDISGMFIGYALSISCLVDYQNPDSDIRFFIHMINVAYIALFADAMACLMNGLPEYRLGNIAVNTTANICDNLNAYFFWLYTMAYLGIYEGIVKKLAAWFRAGLLLAVAASLFNIYNKMFFWIDEMGIYHIGPEYRKTLAYAFFIFIAALIAVVTKRKQLNIFKVCVFFVSALIPVIEQIFVLEQRRLSFISDPTIFCALLIYCILNVSHGIDMAVSDRNLALASEIQENSLPKTFPFLPERKEFDLFASMKAARKVGGDFYDFLMVDEDHLALVIGDVSDKGIPAALFMMRTITLIRNTLLAGEKPAEVMFQVNQQLCEGNSAELFVTVWLAVVELSTGKGVAVNAGHLHPVLKRADGDYRLIKYQHSMAVAVMENMSFEERKFTLNPGDVLFVYTDGVTEARNTERKLFGEARLVDVLNSEEEERTPEKIVNNVSEHLAAFANGASQSDDITMLCMTYFGKE